MDRHRRSYLRKVFANNKFQKLLLFVVTTAVLYIASVLELLNRNDWVASNAQIQIYIGVGLLVMIVELTGLFCLNCYKKSILERNGDLALISLILIIATIISSSCEIISPYLIPVGFISMLISVVYGPLAALSISIPYASILLCVTNFNVGFIVVYVLGCMTGVIFTHKTSIRSSIIFGGSIIGIVNGFAVFSLGMVHNQQIIGNMFDSLIAVLGGLLSSIFTIGFLPVFEQVFDINTPVRLLEISNPNQPLMKKLLFEAPGTYHHSILVGNLSEAAAEAIGANSLLARVGAYYHDIGKIKRPYFFKENQVNNDNPHDKITPKLSSIIITSHVKDGVELSDKFKLPRAIRNIIEEHHGSTLVKYFYTIAATAAGNGEGEEVDENSFRYDGPIPSSKESGIVMLADSVEAAVRSLSNPTLNDIEKMVEKIIRDKIEEHQFDNCDLTMREIEKIKETFVKVLGGMFHNRIEYPEIMEDTSTEEIVNDRDQQ